MLSSSLARLLPFVLAGLVSGCALVYPQRLPGPLVVPGAPDETRGEAEMAYVTLQRDSDPVWIQRAGERGAVAVPFYAKRQRVPVGSLVRTGAGGRAELLWGADATSLVLFDEGRATLGDPEAGEPVLRLQAVSHAVLVLTPEDRIVLPGGAELVGAREEATGPFFLEQKGRVLRLTNQSKSMASVAYRSAVSELGPGESIDLPSLSSGSAPLDAPAELLQGAGITAHFDGPLEREADGAGLGLLALGAASIQALGVKVRLEAQESARFSLLSLRSEDLPADASVHPNPPEGDPNRP